MNIKAFGKTLERLAIDNSPLILTGVGVAGAVTTAILTGKATIHATRILDNEAEVWNNHDNRLPKRNALRLVAPLYIPAIGVGVVTIVAIVGSNRIGTRRAAALAAAYSVSEKAFEEYRDKVIEKMTPKAETALRDEIAQDRMDRHPASTSEIIITGKGSVLCYDYWSGRYFESDMETLKKAQNDLNYKILSHDYASLNDFYNLLGLDNVGMGESVGWMSSKQMELEFSTTMSDDQRPCIAIRFQTTPYENYFRTH